MNNWKSCFGQVKIIKNIHNHRNKDAMQNWSQNLQYTSRLSCTALAIALELDYLHSKARLLCSAEPSWNIDNHCFAHWILKLYDVHAFCTSVYNLVVIVSWIRCSTRTRWLIFTCTVVLFKLSVTMRTYINRFETIDW